MLVKFGKIVFVFAQIALLVPATVSAATVNQRLQCTTKSQIYGGALDLYCNAGQTAVSATCNAGLYPIFHDSTAPLAAPGRWSSYLIPNAANATGVHCEVLGGQTTVILRCCSDTISQ